MESPRENKNGRKTFERAFPTVDSSDLDGFRNEEGSSPVIKWSEEFRCYTVNGILAPIPLSAVRMEAVAEDEQQESAGESSKKRRRSGGNEEFFFRLFKFLKAEEQYLLEIHEAKTGGIDRYHVFVSEKNGRWKVGVYDLQPGEHVVLQVLHDPTPPLFLKKYELSLQERLVGWTLEKRKRGNGKEDKFYYHRARQFRSFVEVTTFILYSCKLKDLNNHKISEVVIEFEAADEAMMIISNSKTRPLADRVNEKTPHENDNHSSSSSSTKSIDEQSKVAQGE